MVFNYYINTLTLTCGQPASHVCLSYVLAWKWPKKFFAVFVIFTSGVGRPLEILVFFSSKILRENGTERKDWIELIFSLIFNYTMKWTTDSFPLNNSNKSVLRMRVGR